MRWQLEKKKQTKKQNFWIGLRSNCLERENNLWSAEGVFKEPKLWKKKSWLWKKQTKKTLCGHVFTLLGRKFTLSHFPVILLENKQRKEKDQGREQKPVHLINISHYFDYSCGQSSSVCLFYRNAWTTATYILERRCGPRTPGDDGRVPPCAPRDMQPLQHMWSPSTESVAGVNENWLFKLI